MSGPSHERQTRHALWLEVELSRYRERLRDAFGVRPCDRVLDIGCGAAATTRDAARAAHRGSAHGVDLSAPVIATARRLAAEDGMRNVTFEQADAQAHPFPAKRFDLGISRFARDVLHRPGRGVRQHRPGTAARSAAGAAGLAARRPAGVGHGYQRRALRRPPAPVTGGPFSLADPPAVHHILGAAGFADVEVTELSEPVHYGPRDDAYDFVLGLEMARDLLAKLDPADVPAAHDRLRAVLAAHDTGAGVWFDSRAWLVTARRY